MRDEPRMIREDQAGELSRFKGLGFFVYSRIFLGKIWEFIDVKIKSLPGD